MKTLFMTAMAATLGWSGALSAEAATFSQLDTDLSSIVKFTPATSEADLISRGATSVTIGATTIYIGTDQVSPINQDPLITSFTNGVRNWVRYYDRSGVDAKGLGLLWDEDSANLYGVFTADGGSQGADTFGSVTQGGWLPSYGFGGGPTASVLLKLDPNSGAVETGTYVYAQLPEPNQNTNSVIPTGIDFVNGDFVFFGNSFFTPLDVNGDRLENRTPGLGSPFPYRLVLSADLTTAKSAEAIGWDGVTEFSPLTTETGDGTNDSDTGDGTTGEDATNGETTGDNGSAGDSEDNNNTPNTGGIVDDIGDGAAGETVPEPGVLAGLLMACAGMARLKKSDSTHSAT
ncbi:MAG: PEP-CTERM sorting domain-containing protein [Leptolyngbyaceae cyanobacterium]